MILNLDACIGCISFTIISFNTHIFSTLLPLGLLALKKCIEALNNQAAYTPYQDSKLTMLLSSGFELCICALFVVSGFSLLILIFTVLIVVSTFRSIFFLSLILVLSCMSTTISIQV